MDSESDLSTQYRQYFVVFNQHIQFLKKFIPSDKSYIRDLLINAIWFKIAWLLCVYQSNAAAIFVIPATVIIHIWIIPLTQKQWRYAFLVTLLGVIFDLLLSAMGIVIFPGNAILPPLWLTTIWFVFGTLIPVALAPVIHRRILFVFLSGIGGMLSYTFGSSISPANLNPNFYLALVMLWICWMVMGYLLQRIYILMLHKTGKSYA